MEPLLISINDAATALGLGRTKIYELIACEELETVCIGGRRLVRLDSVKSLAKVPSNDVGDL